MVIICEKSTYGIIINDRNDIKFQMDKSNNINANNSLFISLECLGEISIAFLPLHQKLSQLFLSYVSVSSWTLGICTFVSLKVLSKFSQKKKNERTIWDAIVSSCQILFYQISVNLWADALSLLFFVLRSMHQEVSIKANHWFRCKNMKFFSLSQHFQLFLWMCLYDYTYKNSNKLTELSHP